jgi:hypothetical protein
MRILIWVAEGLIHPGEGGRAWVPSLISSLVLVLGLIGGTAVPRMYLAAQSPKTYGVDLVFEGRGSGTYQISVGNFAGSMNFKWENAAQPLQFRDVPVSGPFEVTAETQLKGSWEGTQVGHIDLKFMIVDQYCFPKKSNAIAQVKVTLSRSAAHPQNLKITLEPLGEGFFERDEGECYKDQEKKVSSGVNMADPWPISPERLFRSGFIGESQDLQNFYDKTEIASFEIANVPGYLSGDYKVNYPKEEISATPSQLGLVIGSYHVKIDGNVKISATPMATLDLPPVKKAPQGKLKK